MAGVVISCAIRVACGLSIPVLRTVEWHRSELALLVSVGAFHLGTLHRFSVRACNPDLGICEPAREAESQDR